MIARIKNQITQISILTIICVIVLSNLCNQFCFGQSFFSMRGFGEELLYTDATASSLGGLVGLGRVNPSFPLSLSKTTFSATVFSNFVYGQQSGNSRMIYDIRPVTLDGKFPLPYQLRVGIKLSELFNQNFNIYSDSIPFSGTWTRRHIIGQGGIYGLSVNVGKSLFKDKLALSFEYSKLLGQALESWYFEVLSGNSYITHDSVITTYSAHRLCFGAFANINYLSFGLVMEDILPGIINSKVISHSVVVDSVNGLTFNLPYGVGFGIVFDKFPKTKFMADFMYRNWEKATIADASIPSLRNSMKYSLAVEHWLTDKYPLRVGLRYYASYLSDHTGKGIDEFALSCGSSVPIPKFGSFAYSLEIIRRQGQEVKETIGRLNISLYYEEVWKKRTRRWGF